MRITRPRLAFVLLTAISVLFLVLTSPMTLRTTAGLNGTLTGLSPARADAYSSVTTEDGARVITLAGQPNGERLACDINHYFGDNQGTFTIRHRCGGTTAAWGYRISGQLQPFISTPVVESGMEWAKNGVRQPKMAPHTEGAGY